MSSSVLIALFAFLFVATLIACISLYVNLKNQIQIKDNERDTLKAAFDVTRKEKFDLQELVDQAQNQEKTYKVAFEDWKSKYDLLEAKYNSLKRDSEHKTAITEKSELKEQTKASGTENLSEISELSKITYDLKSILNQHLEVLGKMVNTDSNQQEVISTPNVQSDPLHWIMGIDEDTSKILKNQGIQTFEQLYNLPKTEIKKLMIQFEEIDDRIIESWPMQAGAIIRSKN
ncbi:MAG: hypothetical protein HOP11_01525 [Saprospiraceae bacterium]|nr:hypothetical protein [Saprospiraceae bacterium]